MGLGRLRPGRDDLSLPDMLGFETVTLLRFTIEREVPRSLNPCIPSLRSCTLAPQLGP